MLGGGRGVFGVDGSSVMNGDVEGWRSSARTPSAGVPLVAEYYRSVSVTLYPDTFVVDSLW